MSGPEPVILDELGGQRRECQLTPGHVNALAATKLVTVRPLGGGRFRLRPNRRVGAVRIGELDVQVRPKIEISRLLFMLGYAKHPGFVPPDVGGQTEPDLWPALAESLIRQAEQALRPGVVQGYVTTNDSLPLVRGRIRIADQIARRPGGRRPPSGRVRRQVQAGE